jgi:rhodanese-related sulfurtransferase
MNLFARFFGASVPKMSATELQEKIRTGKRPFILDVRQAEEYRLGHIPGAKLIPQDEIKQSIETLPKQREIVCVCASGSRSISVARILVAKGFQVFNMPGGMSVWNKEKFPLKKGLNS